ncbi:SDR family NAD(P)-dependent oxidoreductase [Hydromonas duriensis]|uniref:Short-subunit dehydrogenase n=1 Tax=Hydromonas duriensis TaxID=1527608 RepID=A0A4R6Y8X3_9BURK|nr:SDR family NAD(P)-dependent oxidoreductase [Hydromonas duriensis]TDR31872.1 hypothetical protein DFR44_10789 [Hydromonas duriensis]
MSSLSQKYGPWALVTGATSGIGEELALQAAEKGLNIVLVARNKDELEQSAHKIMTKYGVQTHSIATDLSKQDDIARLFEQTQHLDIGLLILSAAVEVTGAFEKNDLARELQMIDLNVKATMQLTHHYVKPMVARKQGGVLMLASLSGQMPNPYLASYAGTKAYVINFGASLYGELKSKGVDVTVLSPGLTITPMSKAVPVDWNKTPMKAMEARDVAAVGLGAIGKKALVVPGARNTMMAIMSKLTPVALASKMNAVMMRKAIKPELL